MAERQKVVVVVPTYNERENLPGLLAALDAEAARMPHDLHVLVVDDDSPDGTAEVARSGGDRVHLLSGPKQGLGVAYVRGIRHALRELDAGYVVQMDADGSHDPADVPRLVAALDAGADFVIGARYVSGGHAPADWGLLRRTISWLANNVGARLIGGLHRIHDGTNGFRAIRGSLLRRIDLEATPPRGYAVLVYLIHSAFALGARVEEVPVTFENRSRGESKLRLSDALEFFVNVWWIRYDRPNRFYGLALGGISGIVANLATIVLLLELTGMPALAASAIAIEVSVAYSFAWREVWALAARRPSGAATWWRLLLYHLASAPSALLTFGTFAALHATGLHYLAAQSAAVVPALVWNYLAGDRLLERGAARGAGALAGESDGRAA